MERFYYPLFVVQPLKVEKIVEDCLKEVNLSLGFNVTD